MSTDFKYGLTQYGGVPVGTGPFTGANKFVDSGHASAADTPSNGKRNLPYATIDYAIGQCTANNGDVIYALAGHTETISGAGSISVDKAGLSIIGLGAGSDRPTLSFTDELSTVTLSAANTFMSNFLLTGDIDAVVAMLVITGADNIIRDIESRDVTGQVTAVITASATADRLKLIDHVHRGTSTAGTVSVVQLTGCDDVEIVSPNYYTDSSAALIDCLTTATVRTKVYGTTEKPAYLWQENANDLCVKDTITASTGQIGPNLYLTLNDNSTNITESVTGATFHLFDPVYVVNLAGEKAILINWTASTDA